MHSGRRDALVLAQQKPGSSATLVKKKMSKGDEITDGLSHADQKEQTENRHQWVSIFVLHQSFPQRREKVPVKELAKQLPTFSAQERHWRGSSLGSISDAAVITEDCFQRAFLVFHRSACVHVITVVTILKASIGGRGY